jgi:hypothetical protein
VHTLDIIYLVVFSSVLPGLTYYQLLPMTLHIQISVESYGVACASVYVQHCMRGMRWYGIVAMPHIKVPVLCHLYRCGISSIVYELLSGSMNADTKRLYPYHTSMHTYMRRIKKVPIELNITKLTYREYANTSRGTQQH